MSGTNIIQPITANEEGTKEVNFCWSYLQISFRVATNVIRKQ